MTMMQRFKNKTTERPGKLWKFYIFVICPIILISSVYGLIKIMTGVSAFSSIAFLNALLLVILSVLTIFTAFLLDRFSFFMQLTIPTVFILTYLSQIVDYFLDLRGDGSYEDMLTYWFVLSSVLGAILVAVFLVYLISIRDLFGIKKN